MAEKLVRFCLSHRWLMLFGILILSAMAASGFSRLQFDNSLEIWFLEGDPGIEQYHKFLEQFGTDQILVLAWESPDVMGEENLAKTRRLEKQISQVKHVVNIQSLTSAAIPRTEGTDLAVGKLFGKRNKIPADILTVRKKAALASPLLTSTLLSKDGQACAIIIDIEHREGEFERERELLAQIYKIIDAEQKRDGVRLVLAGSAILDRAFFDYTERDMILFLPLIWLGICIAILLFFRKISATLIPIAVVTFALIWIYGLQAWLGWKITVVSSILAPLIMSLGIADAVHVLSEYYDQLLRTPKKEAAVQALVTVFRPCLFTSLTTAAGFLSLLASPIRPVKQVGILAAFGVLVTFVITVMLVPAALSLLPALKKGALDRIHNGLVHRVLNRLEQSGPGRDRISVMLAIVLVLISIVGLSKLRIGTNMLDFFHPDDPVRQATHEVDRLVGGSVTVEYLIQADGENGFLTPDRLKRLGHFIQYLSSQPSVYSVIGLPTILMELDAALRAVPPEQGRLPTNQPQIAQYMMLLEGNQEMRRYVRDNGQVGRLTLRVRMQGAEELSRRVPIIDAYRQEHIETAGFILPSTGLVPLMSRMERFLLDSQLRSFGLALLVISLMMMIVLRSVRLGLFGMIPNLIPVLMTLGLMGFIGIRMDIATVMIASVVLGLVVDDSIHILTRIQKNHRGSRHARDLDRVISESVQSVGRPVVATSLALMIGFWTLLFASFLPNVYFGLLSGVTIFIALIADLIFLPAALRIIRPRLRS